ncbi:HYC_CC_PP family protein [Zhouia sp. PK063]|uniref:HYC_CC_PP family protein n=1 Tax=Zhouia sp. PK063 TaxID=3373602 RepID=UPI003799E6B3
MKKIITKIFATLLTLVVLLSTFSFTVDKHYCMGNLVSVSVIKDAKSCGMDMQLQESHTSSKQILTKSCCKDEKQFIKGQNEIKTNTHDVHLDHAIVVAAFVTSYLQLFENLPKKEIPFQDYAPPILVRDINVLHDTFLI